MTGVLTIDGVEDVQALLAGMAERTKGWTRIAPRIHDFILTRNRELFDSQGRSAGVKWRAYQSEPKYKAFKSAVLGDLTVLRWKGGKQERLYPSMTSAGHPDHVFRRSSDEVAVGTSVPYADRLHKGGTNMFGEPAPPRPLAVLGDRNAERMAQLMAVYIARGESRGNQWER